MAWVLIGGRLTSTVFTLIVIPIAVLFFERKPIRQWLNFRDVIEWISGKLSLGEKR